MTEIANKPILACKICKIFVNGQRIYKTGPTHKTTLFFYVFLCLPGFYASTNILELLELIRRPVIIMDGFLINLPKLRN